MHFQYHLAQRAFLLKLTQEILSETVCTCLCGTQTPDEAKQIPKRGFCTMMFKSEYLVLGLFLVILSGCVQQESLQSDQDTAQENSSNETPPLIIAEGLGTLCPDEEDCRSFCSTHRGQCEAYCKNNKIRLCLNLFPPAQEGGERMYASGCAGKGTVTFNFPPMRLHDVELIEPIGLMIGGHVTPIDHGYYYAKTMNS